jgi:hypothetical protein
MGEAVALRELTDFAITEESSAIAISSEPERSVAVKEQRSDARIRYLVTTEEDLHRTPG